jgi:hypothetical protein
MEGVSKLEPVKGLRSASAQIFPLDRNPLADTAVGSIECSGPGISRSKLLLSCCGIAGGASSAGRGVSCSVLERYASLVSVWNDRAVAPEGADANIKQAHQRLAPIGRFRMTPFMPSSWARKLCRVADDHFGSHARKDQFPWGALARRSSLRLPKEKPPRGVPRGSVGDYDTVARLCITSVQRRCFIAVLNGDRIALFDQPGVMQIDAVAPPQ